MNEHYQTVHSTESNMQIQLLQDYIIVTMWWKMLWVGKVERRCGAGNPYAYKTIPWKIILAIKNTCKKKKEKILAIMYIHKSLRIVVFRDKESRICYFVCLRYMKFVYLNPSGRTKGEQIEDRESK